MSGKTQAEVVRRLEEAVSSMPRVQRQIFEMHRLECLTYEEIAWLLKVSERFVERQMARAIYKLSKQMEGYPLSWWERWF